MNDLKFAIRQLLKSPGFTAVALLSLGLGIGAGTAVFSLVNAVLLRSLPVPNPHELRLLKWSGVDPQLGFVRGAIASDSSKRAVCDGFSYPVFSSLSEELNPVANVFGYCSLDGMTVRAQREAFVANGLMVSDNFFAGLGLQARVGRLLRAEDNREGAEPATVISHALWEQQFGLDPTVLGQRLVINGHSFTVAGVLPREFSGIRAADRTAFYVPMTAQPQLEPYWARSADDLWWVQLMARLHRTTSDTQFQAAADVVFARMVGAVMEGPRVLAEEGRAGPVHDRNLYRKPLLLLLGVVAVVVLVACANLAGLSLARSVAREHEYAVRAAIGAGRWRLVRQSLVESLTLALIGAGVGVILALWGKVPISRLLAGSPDGLRYDTGLDTKVLGFTLVTALVTALLSGLLPALRAGRIDPLAGLQTRGTQGSPRLRLGRTLVVVQVALSLVLLTGAGLYGRTLINLVRINPGFETDDLLLFHVNAGNAGYEAERRVAFYEEIQDCLEHLAGVQSAAVSQYAMLGRAMSGGSFFTLPGYPTSGADRPRANRLTVSESFLDTMQIPVVRGRGFRTSDREGAPKVVLVNETFANTYLAGESPVGQTLRTGEWKGEPMDWQIVGVVGNVRYNNVKEDAPPTVYFSFRQDDLDSTFFAVRTSMPPLTIVPAVRKAVAGIDPNVPLSDISTQQTKFDQNITQERLFATLCGALAGLALLLCCIGLYGLVAYNVTRRTGEIGIRMALGATRQNIASPIVRESLLLAGVGVGLGVPMALALTRLIQSQLYGVETNDPLSFCIAVLALLLVAVGAAWIPARRATRVDPMTALRAE